MSKYNTFEKNEFLTSNAREKYKIVEESHFLYVIICSKSGGSRPPTPRIGASALRNASSSDDVVKNDGERSENDDTTESIPANRCFKPCAMCITYQRTLEPWELFDSETAVTLA